MKIEIPNIKDWEEVNKLAIQVHELHVGWRPDLFNSVEKVISREEFNEMIKNKNIFVAKDEDSILGYIVIIVKENKNQSNKVKKRKLLYIDAMCVDEKSRGMGIGTKLLNHAKQIGLDNNCTDMYLTVNGRNSNAIKTYEKFGMNVENIRYSMEIDK